VSDTALPDQKLSLLASALAASLCVLWGANTVAIKFSLSGLGPFTSAAVRFGISTLFLWAWAKMSGQSLRPAPGQLRHLLINSLLFTLQLSLVYVGFTLTSASRGALITNLQPFFLLFLAHFFLAGDRITFLKLIGLILGWVAPTAPAPRSWTLVLAPSVPMAIAIVAYVTRGYGAPIEDSILAWFGIVALYSYGPVALGRGLRIASIRLRGLGT